MNGETDGMKRQRLDEMWESLVRPTAEPGAYEADRASAGLQMLRALQRMAKNESDHDVQLMLLSKSMAVWQLIASDVFDWFSGVYRECLAGDADIDLEDSPRTHLAALLRIVDVGISPLHRSAIEPCAPLLPRSIHLALKNALEALQSGEVQKIIAPSPKCGHQAPWSWDQARLRALQHILFRVGKGQSKISAQKQVATAMKVGTETFRSWERQLRRGINERHLDEAMEAGKLASAIEVDPRSWSSENSVDAKVAHVMLSLQDERLSDFGLKYHEEFGHRHSNHGGD